MSGHASKIGNDVSQAQAPTVTRLSHTWAMARGCTRVQQFDFTGHQNWVLYRKVKKHPQAQPHDILND